jgi:predicted PurR-regulated permease PerM
MKDWSLSARYIAGVVSLAAFIAFLVYAREAVKMLVIAGFIAYLVSPAVTALMRRAGLSRAAAVNIVYFSALLAMLGAPAALTPIFFDEIKIVVGDLLNLSQEISQALVQPVELGGFVFHFKEVGESLAQMQESLLAPLPAQILALLESASINTLWMLVILVSVHLFLSEWPRIRDWLIDLAPPDYRHEARELYRRIRGVWMAYLRGQIVLMLVVGVVFTIAWAVIGIPGALALGAIAGLFTLVPDVGPFLAVALAFGVALLEGSSWIPLSNFWVAGIVVAVYLTLINIKNFFLRPIIMGRSLQMNEALIFIAIMIATILEGIMGALLVVPVMASVAVIMEYLRRRILGLDPFDGETRFKASMKESKPRRPARAVPKEKRKTKS